MRIADHIALSLMSQIDRHRRLVGKPFDPSTFIGSPSGRHSWVHYGVMVPGLPAPHHSFGVMSIVGTPGTTVFANDHAITTTPSDTAYLVSATGAMRAPAFHTYSIAQDCEFAPDGSLLRFGDDLVIEGSYPTFDVHRRHPDVDVDLRLHATDKVTPFVDARGGNYSHWSLLCEYEGTVGDLAASGLCNFEYARGVGVHSLPLPGTPNLPTTFFNYHVLNIDEKTQLLVSEVRTVGGIAVVRAAQVRGLDDYGVEYTDVRLSVEEHEPEPHPTPDGRVMRLPSAVSIAGNDDDGVEVFRIDGKTNGDWSYGLGAGFVGSYAYDGVFRGRSVQGTAYMEYVDLA